MSYEQLMEHLREVPCLITRGEDGKLRMYDQRRILKEIKDILGDGDIDPHGVDMRYIIDKLDEI